MPQNNTDITSSPEFKEFCKNNNLEVFNLESFQLALFTSCYADRHILDRIQKLEERLNERRDAVQEANESPFRD